MYNLKMLGTISKSIICYITKLKNITLKNATIKTNKHLTKENRNKVLTITIIGGMMIFCNILQITMFSKKISYNIILLDIFSLVVYFFISIQNIIKITKLQEMDKKIHNLETHNKTLSIMYDKIRSFRHDFSNFIQALDGYTKINDIEGVKLISAPIIKECKDVKNMEVLDPQIINNPAVYSIITNKYYLAQKNNIVMNIEIMINLNELNIITYEFCRILGILLDNAIEAAKECKEKVINVRFIKDFKANRKLVIIENTFNEIDIDLDKIYEKGYSTKKDNNDEHGLGLWTVRNILSKSNNLNLFTTKDELFRQQLEIYE